MLCTAMCAWSYTTKTVTKTPSDSRNGIVSCNEFMIMGNLDKTTGLWKTGLAVGYINSGCVITSVELVVKNGNIDQCECENWKFDATAGKWVQDGTFAYYDNVSFKSSSNCLITSVTITYHKHTLAKKTDAKAATCTRIGVKASWECSDCGHIYYDEKGASEVAKFEDLTLDIDPKNHPQSPTEVLGVDATCVATGTMHHWHCNACNHNFEDANGEIPIAGDNVTLDIDPKNHNGMLHEVAYKEATCIEEGVLHHWHCDACGMNYSDGQGKTAMTDDVTTDKWDADALLVWDAPSALNLDESYLLGESAVVTFDNDVACLAVNGTSREYELSETDALHIDFDHTFTLTATEDPANEGVYYATFFNSTSAYAVPVDGSVVAYAGTLERLCDDGTGVLHLTPVADGGEATRICRGEPVVLKAYSDQIVLMPSASQREAAAQNDLNGTDEELNNAPENAYALATGDNGIGFYHSTSVDAHNAYYLYNMPANISMFKLDYTDTPTGVNDLKRDNQGDGRMYDILGRPVNDDYKGIVIMNGKKFVKK